MRFFTIGIILLSSCYSGLFYADPEIEISGLNSEQEDNVRAYLSLSKEVCDAPSWKIKRLFKQEPLQINEALRALGYYQPQITKTLDWEERCWNSSFVIVPGSPMIIEAIDAQVLGQAQMKFFAKLIQKSVLKWVTLLITVNMINLKRD